MRPKSALHASAFPSLYTSLVTRISNLLCTLYAHVSTPPPAPSKSSHGDIDILVCSPWNDPAPDITVLATLLGAARTLSVPPSCSLAILHPEEANAYVQVDLRVCNDVESWQWQLFHHAYGDLWNLLGTAIRPWGLTANEEGLHLRIEEIETKDRKKSLIWLSKHPRVVCEVLGVNADRLCIDDDGLIHNPENRSGTALKSVQELYALVLTSRFFRRESYTRSTLKSNDRKRMAQRDAYSTFVSGWLPNYQGPDGGDPALTRAAVTREMLETFNARTEYENRIKLWRLQQEALRIKRESKKERKMERLEEEQYAEAWINEIRRRQNTYS